MRQRALTPAGDYSFGSGSPFLVDSPECVAQAVMTRLRLQAGEWFLDADEGTPYQGRILGHNTAPTRDVAIRARILDTPGVVQINAYASYVDTARRMTVAADVQTIYGPARLSAPV